MKLRIEPIDLPPSLLDYLSGLSPIDDTFPNVDSGLLPLDDIRV